MTNFQGIANFLWSIADEVLRDDFKRGKYPDVILPAPVKKGILAALGEREETADPCLDADGNPEPDPDLRDHENVPLMEDVRPYFEREVLTHVPDAWISEETRDRDKKDSGIGKVGYEINFNRHFYEYTLPRPLEEMEADIRRLEGEILEMLREVGA